MKAIHGRLMMATGILHSAIVAPICYRDKWKEFFAKGFFSVSDHVGWELLAFGACFSWMTPESGFTLLVIPQAIYILFRSRRTSGTNL